MHVDRGGGILEPGCNWRRWQRWPSWSGPDEAELIEAVQPDGAEPAADTEPDEIELADALEPVDGAVPAADTEPDGAVPAADTEPDGIELADALEPVDGVEPVEVVQPDGAELADDAQPDDAAPTHQERGSDPQELPQAVTLKPNDGGGPATTIHKRPRPPP